MSNGGLLRYSPSVCRPLHLTARPTASYRPMMELGRRGAHRAIIGVCTAGGMATAAFLER
jgi:hypothetical protein